MRTWGSEGTQDGMFNVPMYLAVFPGTEHIIVTDYDNHRVQKFDKQGKFLGKFGKGGNALGEFKNPFGIAIHPHTKQIIVADGLNNRFQIIG